MGVCGLWRVCALRDWGGRKDGEERGKGEIGWVGSVCQWVSIEIWGFGDVLLRP